ncbi:hypothetical protein [Pseudomonas serbica]|uniref:hypothetical protein n=1 Tax=Pseudomonas serbica TaxID=2965074 RepID=UPI00237B66C2|nr:hypothetical protein [Pseudomonas serbica]
MYIESPGFETRGVLEITDMVENLSWGVDLAVEGYDTATGCKLVDGYKLIDEDRMRHWFNFGLSQKNDQVSFGMRYSNKLDILAIEAVFAEMARLIPLIESGEVAPECGYVEIYKRGLLFAFRMNLSTRHVLECSRNDQGREMLQKVKSCSPFTNNLTVYVVVPTGELVSAIYNLYAPLENAISVANDFAMMRATIR